MGKVDIEELKKLNYEEGAELLALVGYVESDETTADASGISELSVIIIGNCLTRTAKRSIPFHGWNILIF